MSKDIDFADYAEGPSFCDGPNKAECLQRLAEESAARKQQQEIAQISALIVIFVLIIAAIYFVKRKRDSIGAIKFDYLLKAIISAWSIWVAAVLSFIWLLDYIDSISKEQIFGWLVVPPSLVLMTIVWIKKYLAK